MRRSTGVLFCAICRTFRGHSGPTTMRKRIISIVAVLLVTVPVASAEPVLHTAPQKATTHTKQETKYLKLYWSVVRSHGRRAPGRNIVSRGVATHGHVRSATKKELATSIRQLRQLLHPAPRLLVRTARPPVQPPAGIASPGVAVGSAHMACIISHESGGNPRAVNGQYHGIGQWSPASWAHYGGTKYATDPVNASYEQQLMVLASEGDAGMSQQQGQYDNCG